MSNGAGVDASVAETRSSFSDFLVKGGVAPEQAAHAAEALVHRIVDALAHGESPETAVATAREDMAGVIAHLEQAAQAEGPPSLDQALARGDPQALARAAHELGVDGLPPEAQKAALTAWQSALANGADSAHAREAALDKAQSMVRALADGAVELSHGDSLAAQLAGGGPAAGAAIQAMTAGLPSAQAAAMMSSLTGALAGGFQPSEALQGALAAARSAQGTGDSQGVAVSQGDMLVAALAGGGDVHAALAAAGLSGAAVDAFLQALAGSAGSDAALSVAHEAQAAANQALAQASAGVQGSALAAALASGGADAAAALAGLGGSGAGQAAFAAALGQALAGGASLDSALGSANFTATQVAAVSSANGSSLLAALASGQNAASALAAAGASGSESGQAFAAALSNALANGASVEAAVQQAGGAASAAQTQMASSFSPVGSDPAPGSGPVVAQGPGGSDPGTGSPSPPAASPPASPPSSSADSGGAHPVTTASDANQTPAPSPPPSVPDLPATAPTPPPATLTDAPPPAGTSPPVTIVTHTLSLAAPAAIALADTAAVDSFADQTGTLSAADSTGGAVLYGISGGTSGSYVIGGVTYDYLAVGSYGTLYVKASSGAYDYVPNATAINALGVTTTSDSFTVTAYDGGLSSSGALTVTVTGVNDTPVWTATPSAISYTDTAAVDSFGSATGSLSVTDAEGSALTYGISGQSAASYTSGGVSYDEAVTGSYGTLHLKASSGAYVYVPSATAINALAPGSYSESFTFSASDGSLSATGTLTVGVTGVNDTPVWTATPSAISYTDTAAVDSFSSATGSLSVTDAEGSTLTYGISGQSAASYQPGVILYDESVTGSYGTLYLKASSGAYVYVPNATAINALGATTTSDSFTFSASDGSLSATSTLTVNVTGVNDTPVWTATPAAITETDTAATDTVASLGGSTTGTASVSDAEGNTLTYSISNTLSGTETATTYAPGAITYDESVVGNYGTLYVKSTSGAYIFVPNATAINALGAGSYSESFTFKATDTGSLYSTNTLTVNVTGANDSPTGSVSVSGTAAQDQVLSASNTLGDLDGLGTISYQWRVSPDGSGSWTDISGATSSTLTLAAAQIGEYVDVVASYVDGHGITESVASSATGAVVAGTTLAGTSNDGSGHYYQYYATGAAISWSAAEAVAVSSSYHGLAGHLAAVTSSAENALVVSLLNGQNAWLGGYRIATSGSPQFAWADGETFSYSNWNSGEPNNSGGVEDSLEMYVNGQWNDLANAGNVHAYVIEYDGLANGDFETGDLTGWTVSGSTQYVSVSSSGAENGSYCLKAGTVGAITTFSQTIADVASNTMALSFYLYSNNDALNDISFSASLNGAVILQIDDGSFPAAWQQYSVTFTSTGSDTLTFAFRNDPSYIYMDNVTLSCVGDPPLPAVAENTLNPRGETIAALFSATHPAQVSIVADAATADQGSWQYSTDGGAVWITLVAGNTPQAILNPDDLLRFVPSENWNGTPGTLLAGLIDTPGGAVSGYDVISTSVTAVNNAPVASGEATLAPVAENAADPAGATVATLVSANFSDAADAVAGGSSANLLAGIAIVGDMAGHDQGVWQYSADHGVHWTAIDAGVSDAAALVLSASDELRFLPDHGFEGAPGALTARLIESGGGALASGSVVDLSGAGATGGGSHVSAGTVTIDTGVSAGPLLADDHALGFDGSSHVDVAGAAALSPTAALTLEAWVQLSAAGGGILDDLSGNAGYKLAVDAAGHLQFTIGDGSATATLTASGPSLADGGWHQVAASYDGAALHLYVDDADVADLTGLSAGALGQGGALSLGGGLNGALNDVRLWSGAHGLAQIGEETSHALTGGESGLAGYWKFDESAGGSFANSVAGASWGNGTAGGSPSLIDLLNQSSGTAIQVSTNASSYKGMILAAAAAGDSLSYAVAANGGPAHGSVAFTDNAFVYTPTSGHITQDDSFTVEVTDAAHHVTDHAMTLHPV